MLRRHWGRKTLVLFSWSFLTALRILLSRLHYGSCPDSMPTVNQDWCLVTPVPAIKDPRPKLPSRICPSPAAPAAALCMHGLPTPLLVFWVGIDCILFWVWLAFLVLLVTPVSGLTATAVIPDVGHRSGWSSEAAVSCQKGSSPRWAQWKQMTCKKECAFYRVPSTVWWSL